MALWKYDGPVYVDGKKISDREILFTNAKTKEEAGRNFFYRGRKFDVIYPNIEFVEYDADELAELESEYRKIVNGEDAKVCPHCGGTLSDGGLCYNCNTEDF